MNTHAMKKSDEADVSWRSRGPPSTEGESILQNMTKSQSSPVESTKSKSIEEPTLSNEP